MSKGFRGPRLTQERLGRAHQPANPPGGVEQATAATGLVHNLREHDSDFRSIAQDESAGWGENRLFSWPGLGRYLATAFLTLDLNAVVGGTMLVALTFSLANLAVDLIYAFLNPKITLTES